MKTSPKTTLRRSINVFSQIVQRNIPGWKIDEFAREEKNQGEWIFLQLADIPAYARAVPAPVQPERASRRVAGMRMRNGYQETLRRITARVEVNGEWREMTFLTNNFDLAASTVAALYKSRWEAGPLFKELKQTLQLQDFYGENENAVRWQIWAALLVHLLLRYIKFLSQAKCSYTRFTGIIRVVVWPKKDLMSTLQYYGIAPPPKYVNNFDGVPYLPGFEHLFLKVMG